MNSVSSMPISFLYRLAASLLTGIAIVALVACGGSHSPAHPETGTAEPPTAGSLALLAGSIGGAGNLDGMGTAARFGGTTGIARDTAGNLFIADMSNYTIRKITPDGNVSTFAGTSGMQGIADGVGAAARFIMPTHVAVDSAGNVFVVDSGEMSTGSQSWLTSYTIRKITPNGTVSTFFGTPYAYSIPAAGPAPAGRITGLGGIAIDDKDNLYVFGNQPVYGGVEQQLIETKASVLKITPQGNASTYWSLDAYRTGFSGEQIVVDKSANLYIKLSEKTIRKVSKTGAATDIDIPVDTQEYHYLTILGVDSNDNVYLSDWVASKRSVLLRLEPGGAISAVLSVPIDNSTSGAAAVPPFSVMSGLTADNAGNLYVAGAYTVHKIGTTGAVSTIAGALRFGGNRDGIGDGVRFGYDKIRLAAIAGDDLYAIDDANRSVRKISASGEVSTVLASASSAPSSLAVDAAGNLYVAHRAWVTGLSGGNYIQSRIDRISTTGQVTTFAGSPDVNAPDSLGSADGVGANARFWNPTGLVFDKAGNLYVSDSRNYTIRKITPQGVVTTLAGKAGESGQVDGTGTAARFSGPDEIRVDSMGNLLVLDFANPTAAPLDMIPATVRKITPEGVVTTIGAANNLTERARLWSASNVGPSVTDNSGNIYVAESTDHTIRKIAPSGAVTVVAGVANEKGTRLGALPGRLDSPNSMAFVAPNTLFITSGGSVLKLTLP